MCLKHTSFQVKLFIVYEGTAVELLPDVLRVLIILFAALGLSQRVVKLFPSWQLAVVQSLLAIEEVVREHAFSEKEIDVLIRLIAILAKKMNELFSAR